MAAERRAQVVWEGNLTKGSGRVTMSSSGACGELPVTWASRTERADGRTSPEELLAAAHASCYAMAFSGALNAKGNPPERLDVSATYTFVPGTGITTAALEVRGHVPGMAAAEFERTAREAELSCPVSNAVRNGLEITLDAALAE